MYELRHNGLTYEYAYDFAPNDRTGFMTNQPEAEEHGPFFVVENRGRYSVMDTSETMEDESTMLKSGHFNMRAEAEAFLQQSLQNGSYRPRRLP